MSVKVPPISTAMRKSLTTFNPDPYPARGARPNRPNPALQFAGQGAYGRPVMATAPTLRARIYALLRYSDPTPAARQWRTANLIVLGIGLLAVILLSIDEMDEQVSTLALRTIIWGVTFNLLFEYLTGLWDRSADAALRSGHADQGPDALGGVDPGADRPAGRPAGLHVRRRLRHHRSRRRLGLLHPVDPKLGLHAPAMGTLARVVSNERATLTSVVIIFVMVLIVAATGAHMMERARSPSSSATLPGAVVGGGDAHHDRLRRCRAANASAAGWSARW